MNPDGRFPPAPGRVWRTILPLDKGPQQASRPAGSITDPLGRPHAPGRPPDCVTGIDPGHDDKVEGPPSDREGPPSEPTDHRPGHPHATHDDCNQNLAASPRSLGRPAARSTAPAGLDGPRRNEADGPPRRARTRGRSGGGGTGSVSDPGREGSARNEADEARRIPRATPLGPTCLPQPVPSKGVSPKNPRRTGGAPGRLGSPADPRSRAAPNEPTCQDGSRPRQLGGRPISPGRGGRGRASPRT
jgi:hypothetical protein